MEQMWKVLADVEWLCCKSRPCITTTDSFQDKSINSSVLSNCILDCNDFMEMKMELKLFHLPTTTKLDTDNAFCTVMVSWEEEIGRWFLLVQ